MLYTIGLVAYILAMLAVGFWVKDRVKSTEDFLVAGRKLNTMYSFFALMPCYLGGFVLIGTAGTSFTDGFWSSESQWGILTDSGGAFVCMALCFMFYMPKIWKLRLISLGDLYYDRYGRICGIIASIFLTGGFMFWVATQVLVFAKLIAPILGWDPNFALVVALVVICLYTIMGGPWPPRISSRYPWCWPAFWCFSRWRLTPWAAGKTSGRMCRLKLPIFCPRMATPRANGFLGWPAG